VQIVDADGETIVAVRRSGLTDEQKIKLALYDNRTAELADWDVDVLGALDVDLGDMFFESELAELGVDLGEEPAEDPGAQIDKAAELQEKWQTERGQIWQIGKHRLMCGDSTSAEDVARLMGGATPLLMVTDPPYGVDYDPMFRQEALGASVSRAGSVANDDRADWGDAWRLFEGDVLYCWHGMRTATVVGTSLGGAGFEVRAEIIWTKSRVPFGRGHYHAGHESCWYTVRKGATAHWIGDGSESTVWDIRLDETAEGGHGTQKPLECMARPIRNHEGDVYDPFLGSGTTMVAAEQTGRVCYGMEIEPKYCAVTLERMVGMGLEPVLT